jgi:hypothetical protein
MRPNIPHHQRPQTNPATQTQRGTTTILITMAVIRITSQSHSHTLLDLPRRTTTRRPLASRPHHTRFPRGGQGRPNSSTRPPLMQHRTGQQTTRIQTRPSIQTKGAATSPQQPPTTTNTKRGTPPHRNPTRTLTDKTEQQQHTNNDQRNRSTPGGTPTPPPNCFYRNGCYTDGVCCVGCYCGDVRVRSGSRIGMTRGGRWVGGNMTRS